MADASDAHDADDGLARLQAFLDLLQATRAHVARGHDDLRARADQAQDDAARFASGVRLVGDTLAARADALSAAGQAAVADLAALGEAAGRAAREHADDEAALDARAAELENATAAVAAAVEDAITDRAAAYADAEAVLAGLDRLTAPVLDALEAPRPELELAERVVAQAALGLYAELDGAQHDASALLRPAVEGLLAGHRARLMDEALPYASSALEELEAGAGRAFHELSVGLESSATSLARATVTDLEQRRDSALEALRRHEALSANVETGGVHPTEATADRCAAMLEDAAEAGAAFASLAPRLSAARDVAQQVEDMLDSLNPLD